MTSEGLILEAVDGVNEAVACGVEVGVIDLVRVAGEDDLGVFASAGDDGFDFVGGEVLRFINDHVLAGDGASTDIGEGFEMKHAHIDKFLVGASAAFVFLGETHQEFDVIEDGLHPRAELVFESTGEVAEVATHREDRAADEEALIKLFFEGGLEASGDSEQRFACSCFANERDELDTRIKQKLKREALFFVARLDTPDLLALKAKGFECLAVGFDASEGRVLAVGVAEQRQELVSEEGVSVVFIGFCGGFGGGFERVGFLFGEDGEKVFHGDGFKLKELIDKAARYGARAEAAVEFIDGLGFGFVIFGFEAEGISADTEVDIFADQDGGDGGSFLLHLERDGEDHAIGMTGIVEESAEAFVAFGEEDAQLAAARQDDAICRDIAFLFAKVVERARDLAGATTEFVDVFFELVKFFDDIDGDDDVVVFKLEE